MKMRFMPSRICVTFLVDMTRLMILKKYALLEVSFWFCFCRSSHSIVGGTGLLCCGVQMLEQGDALLQKELSGDSSLEVRRLDQI